MKKIGLISDTHGDFPKRLKDLFIDVDEIWHAGDIGSLEIMDELKAFKPLRAVYGNIDDYKTRLEYPENLIFVCEGVKVVITHIAGKPGKYSKNAADLLQFNDPDLFICGHSHILLVQKDSRFNCVWMNPGAVGLKGFHTQVTAITFTLNQGIISDVQVIDFGKRSEVYNSLR